MCGKKFILVQIYILGSKQQRWNFIQICQLYTKWCAQTFLLIFGLFIIFDQNFLKIMAPPGDKNGQTHVASESASPYENKKLR